MANSSDSGVTEIDIQMANLNTSSRISDKNEACDKNDIGKKEIDSDKLGSGKASNTSDSKTGDKKLLPGDKEPHQISNGKTADDKNPPDSTGDNKRGEGDQPKSPSSPPKDNNNNKDVSTAEEKSPEKTTSEGSPATTSSTETAKGHAPLTTSHSLLSATAAPFIEGLNSVNYKSAKPRPLKMPHNTNVPFSPGHTQLAYAHQYLGPQHHYTGGFHGQSHQSSQQQNHSQSSDSLATDEALEIMENINRAVKSNQFSQILSGQIFRLYNFLKNNGEILEQTNKNELNRVFVSLRQACCRDSGQLGTPCRLKMMELVELRAMGWRPSLSHSQYYLNRAANGLQQQQQTGGGPSGASSNAQNVPSQPNMVGGDGVSSGEMERLGAAPVSAPPYGHMALNPFSFNLPAPAPQMQDMVPNPQMAGPAPSYYLIPASHIGHPPAGLTFVGPSAPGGGPGLLPPPPPILHATHHPLTSTFSTPAGLPSMTPSSSDFPKGAVTKSSTKFSRPTKIPGKNQFRDEVVIRNADSGKIMGVKGRRVSIIEEISKTIISFQKVMQGAKERTLTITGPTEESILQSKILIEDTIRRNVSPAREGEGELPLRHDLDGMSNHSEESDLAGTGENGEQPTETECALAEMGSILKLSCANPAVLQVARRALNEYFHRHEPLRRSSTADAYRYMGGGVSYGKERRKSMPLPLHALSNVAETAEFEALTPKTPVDAGSENGSLTNISKLNRSTPNLAAGERRSILKPLRSFTFDDKPAVIDENRPRVVYTREFLLQCAAHDVSKAKPNILPAIAEQISEIVAPGPDKFDPVIYKRRCSDLKQVRF